MRNAENILSLEYTFLNEERLYSIFSKYPTATLYVTKSGKVTGIITQGDFRRNLLGKEPLVNSKFTFVGVGEENKAIEKLCLNKSIRSVPMLDTEHHLVKEYYIETEEKIAVDFFYQLAVEFSYLKWGYDKIVLLVSGLSEQEKEFAGDLVKSGDNVYISDGLELAEFKKLANEKVFVCDFGREFAYHLRKIYYDKFRIDNINAVPPNDWKRVLCERGELYKKIAVPSEEMDFWKEVLDEGIELFAVPLCDFVWDAEKKCYNVRGNIDKNIEAFFFCGANLEGRSILVDGCEYYTSSLLFQNGNLDIVKNLLPAFDKHHIRYLIIKNPEEEIEEIKGRWLGDFTDRNNLPTKEFYGVSEEDYWKFDNERMGAGPIVMKNGYGQKADYKGKWINYINNARLIKENPSSANYTIWLYGPCLVRGEYVADEDTLGGNLRKKIKSDYYIKNIGGIGARFMNYAMRDYSYQSGDIVVILPIDSTLYKKYNIEVHSIIDAWKIENVNSHVLDRLLHCDKVITGNVANIVYKLFLEYNLLREEKRREEKRREEKRREEKRREELVFRRKKGIELPLDLKKWLEKVSSYKRVAGVSGAIVMNCNPFTRGHRYLIEEATTQVDILYIFVVEEDKSFFKFQDRLHMVELGTQDLENVVVIPSGKYMISTVTLPGYFEKEKNQMVKLDATQDLELFAEGIAKAFDISVRFAGEEPIDMFTRQYNQEMSRILPDYGIEFREIPRKETGGEVISASRVRKYMKDKNYEMVHKLVLPQIMSTIEKYFES